MARMSPSAGIGMGLGGGGVLLQHHFEGISVGMGA